MQRKRERRRREKKGGRVERGRGQVKEEWEEEVKQEGRGIAREEMMGKGEGGGR